jgi:hypothetical protein
MGTTRRRMLLACLAVLLGALLSAAPAGAVITGSSITAPGAGSELFYNADTGSGSVTVRGTVQGATAGGLGDLLCYRSGDTVADPVATGINVSSGAFAAVASLVNIRGEACRLALVPAGKTPTGPAAAPFAGPSVSVSEMLSHSSVGNLYGYYILSGTLPWSFAFSSLGECAINSSYATDPASLGSFPLFSSNACLRQANTVSPAAPTRSALLIDGLNAYLPGSIGPKPTLAGQPGFEPLAYSATFDATHDTVTISETDVPVICDPPATYPATVLTCQSMHDSGVQIEQTTTLLPGGLVARVTEHLTSVDGRAHAVDALFGQSISSPGAGQTPGLEFPGQTSFATHAKPDSFATFGPGPGSIIAIGTPTSAPAVSNPIGAITYNRPPTSADFISATGSATATFLMHYADAVPAEGSILYDWSFSQASSPAVLAQLEQRERNRMAAPTVAITRPGTGSRFSAARVQVLGTVADNVGVASLAVNGRAVAPAANGTFSTVVTLRPGRNLITATASDATGNVTNAQVSVTFALPGCRVPKLKGASLTSARRALSRAHCRVGKVTRARSRTVRSGRVIASRPGSGAKRSNGTKINPVVSRGP